MCFMTLKHLQVNDFSPRNSNNFLFKDKALVHEDALGGSITSKMCFGCSCYSQEYLTL